ncbi:hypothetical protein D0Z07_1997 [Hyphodiscus hymeniophilus]|uniref:Uncharacterized protein n=1 Tax=Hyphodiscus hymeniophilus TaxID=353542 RepID=A0A9P6VPQ2_9HELO|nr:hypothetical protein D0Z07_1997 [Hyphodiscus hymeniophilus]
MAVDNESLTVKAPLANTHLAPKSNQSAGETPTKQSRRNSDVQVSSTLPLHDEEVGPVGKEVPGVEQIQSDSSENLAQVTEEDRETGTDVTEPESSIEMSDWDWHAFQLRYRDAIAHANEEEVKLLEEFEKYFEVFRIWSLATSQRDGVRAWKRLKTRQRYVELAEDKLEERKEHYERVVLAFKNALELLKQ